MTPTIIIGIETESKPGDNFDRVRISTEHMFYSVEEAKKVENVLRYIARLKGYTGELETKVGPWDSEIFDTFYSETSQSVRDLKISDKNIATIEEYHKREL